MKLGLIWGYWTADPPVDFVALTQEAERLGYDCAWSAESWGSDAFSPLAYLAAVTDRIKLGTSVVQIAARTPTAVAMHAMTLDHLSEGRFILGLGVSGPQVVEGWYGQPSERPLARTREVVEIIRTVLRREDHFSFDGDFYQFPYGGPGSEGLGKSLKIMTHPRRAEIPIYIGAEGPRNVAQTAEIADGWIPLYYSPFRPEVYADQIADVGEDFQIPVNVSMYIGDDWEEALWPVKATLGFYIGGMGAKGQNYHTKLMARMGFEEEALRIQDLFLEGKRDEAIAAVPDRLRRRDQPRRAGRAHPRPPGCLGGEPGDHAERLGPRPPDPRGLRRRRPRLTRSATVTGADPFPGQRMPAGVTDRSAHLHQLAGADLVAHHPLHAVLAALQSAADDVEPGAFDDGDQGDGPEALVGAGTGPFVLLYQLVRVPHPGVIDADESAAVRGPVAAHQPPGAHDVRPADPRQHGETVTPEARLEPVGDGGIGVAGLDGTAPGLVGHRRAQVDEDVIVEALNQLGGGVRIIGQVADDRLVVAARTHSAAESIGGDPAFTRVGGGSRRGCVGGHDVHVVDGAVTREPHRGGLGVEAVVPHHRPHWRAGRPGGCSR